MKYYPKSRILALCGLVGVYYGMRIFRTPYLESKMIEEACQEHRFHAKIGHGAKAF